MKVYTDASRDDDVAAMGWIVILDSGAEIEDNRYMLGTYTSMEVEYFALLDGLRMAKRYNREHVDVLTDCRPLIRKMRSPDNNTDWHKRREGAHRLLNKFESWNLEWTPRASNTTADRLAYEALEAGRRP